jgi:hypothetical protein
MLRSLPFAIGGLLMAATASPALAQATGEQLRPHIVRVVNASGEDEYRDDRVTAQPDTTACFIYIARKQSGPLWLRLQVRHSGFTRLDMTEIVFQKDTRRVSIKVMPELLHWGDNGMVTWEWYDTPPSENEMKAIQAIINEPGVQLTLIGKQTVTRELSENERLAMQNVVEQAKVLGHGR